jgi:hypothetical protein
MTSGAASKRLTLELLPYVILNFVSDALARPYVIVKASLKDASGSELWWTRYVSAVNDDRPIDGDTGWSADPGKPFKQAVDRALNTLAAVLVRDVTGKLPRATAKDAKLKAQYAFVRQALDLPGKLVESDERKVVFIPQIGDVVVFAGVNIFAKDIAQIGDAPPAK